MGGTFLQMPEDYKSLFIKGIYDALNGFHSDNVEEAIKSNEKVKTHRAIGLTIETRPDVCTQYIPEMLSYGATRVELGVQHADDRIYKIINRGHRVKSVVDSTRELKNAAFKVLYHIMPGLPGSSPKKDVLFVKKLFSDTRFRPDMLKIYPCLVLKGTKLHEMAQRGKYAPYTSEEAADIISEFYRHIPKYVRVMRIQRDIPANKIDSGVKKSNLRELVENKIREKNITPREIRYREVGLQRGKSINLSGFHIEKLAYNASGGKEYFISYENDDSLIAGFIRLRLPLGSGLGTVALIRELHIYGSEVQIHKTGDVQHRGLGTSLLKEAEQISRDAGRENMKIISGVGVRDFYRKYGYELRDQYMAKSLSSL
jgi:elongator complex protein 3